MLHSFLNHLKKLTIKTEGKLQPSQSLENQFQEETSGIRQQVTVTNSSITTQIINIQCNSAKLTIPEIFENIKILFPALNEVFCGRDDKLNELKNHFKNNQIAGICGMAGIGKTEFAKKYAWTNNETYGAKLWINAESEENIVISVHEIARKLFIETENREIKNIIDDIYEYFKQSKTFLLVVIDNVNDRRSINHILPSKAYHQDTNINILITCQNNKLGKRNGKEIPVIDLLPLKQEYAVQVFLEVLGQEVFENYNITLWKNLAEASNRIPLALQIVSAYISYEIDKQAEFGKIFSLEEYLNILEEEKHLLINEPFSGDSENEYPHTIYAAVNITLNKIKSNEQCAEFAFNVFYNIAYLNTDYIFENILLKLEPEENLIPALSVLSKFYLINSKNFQYKRKISVHRLVQWISRYHQIQCNKQNEFYSQVLNNLLNHDGWNFFHHSTILKHEKYFKELIKNYISDTNIFAIEILIENNSYNSLSLIFQNLQLVNFQEVSKWFHTAIYTNSIYCTIELVQYLDKNSVDFNNYKTTEGILLHSVMKWKNKIDDPVNCVRVIAEKCDVNVQEPGGYTPLMIAARLGLVKTVKMFVEEFKADVTIKERNGWTALHYLIAFSSLSFSEELSPENTGTLLMHDTIINDNDKQGRSLLHHSARYPSPVYAKYFLKNYNLNPNLLDNNGEAPIILFFEHTLQQTLMHLSSCFKKNENNIILMIDLLVNKGADIYVVNKKGNTVLQLALENYPKVVSHLKNTYNLQENSTEKK